MKLSKRERQLLSVLSAFKKLGIKKFSVRQIGREMGLNSPQSAAYFIINLREKNALGDNYEILVDFEEDKRSVTQQFIIESEFEKSILVEKFYKDKYEEAKEYREKLENNLKGEKDE